MELADRWEYVSVRIPPNMRVEDTLNPLGDQGWELVAILPSRPEPGGGLMGLGPPRGPGGPGMPGGLPKMKPDTCLFKRPR